MKFILSVLFALMTITVISKEYASSSEKATPNFILILTDDQSWVGTSFLTDPADPRSKSDYYQTPNMERLAQMGMRFTNGYAPAPFCCSTRKSITIGQTPAKNEYQRDRENWTKEFRKQLSIPQMLKATDSDYKTAPQNHTQINIDHLSNGICLLKIERDSGIDLTKFIKAE